MVFSITQTGEIIPTLVLWTWTGQILKFSFLTQKFPVRQSARGRSWDGQMISSLTGYQIQLQKPETGQTALLFISAMQNLITLLEQIWNLPNLRRFLLMGKLRRMFFLSVFLKTLFILLIGRIRKKFIEFINTVMIVKETLRKGFEIDSTVLNFN